IEITWADIDAVKNAWLQVTVKANTNTGLANDDVFYFGNAIGDTGNSTSNGYTTAIDEIGARYYAADLTGLPASLAIINPYDFNRDGHVDAADELIAGSNYTNFITALNLIAPPAIAPAATGSSSISIAPLNPVTPPSSTPESPSTLPTPSDTTTQTVQ